MYLSQCWVFRFRVFISGILVLPRHCLEYMPIANLRHIKPARMLGGIIGHKATPYPVRLVSSEGLFKARPVVGVQVVHHQYYLFRRIVFFRYALQEKGEVSLCPPFGHLCRICAPERFDGKKDIRGAVLFVFVIYFLGAPRASQDRLPLPHPSGGPSFRPGRQGGRPCRPPSRTGPKSFPYGLHILHPVWARPTSSAAKA